LQKPIKIADLIEKVQRLLNPIAEETKTD